MFLPGAASFFLKDHISVETHYLAALVKTVKPFRSLFYRFGFYGFTAAKIMSVSLGFTTLRNWLCKNRSGFLLLAAAGFISYRFSFYTVRPFLGFLLAGRSGIPYQQPIHVSVGHRLLDRVVNGRHQREIVHSGRWTKRLRNS